MLQAPWVGYSSGQERVQRAGLGCSNPAHSQERPVSSACLSGNPWPASGSWDLSSWTTPPDKRITQQAPVWFMVNTCFISREPESVLWVLHLYDWLPVKTLDPNSRVSVPEGNAECVLSHTEARIKHFPGTSLQEDTRKLTLDFSWTWLRAFFLSADFTRCLFSVINHNGEDPSLSDSCGSFWWLTEPEGDL